MDYRKDFFRRFSSEDADYRVECLYAYYYRLATPEEIAAEIERLKARIADLEST